MADTHDTIDGLLAEFREHSAGIPPGYFVTMSCHDFQRMLNRFDAAHKREIDVLKQRRAELNAEVAAKDEVIKRLNDAISEEQRRKMATADKSSAVGDVAKLREAVIETQSTIAKCMDILNKIPECGYNVLIDDVADELCGLLKEHIKAVLSAPPRNCDIYLTEEAVDAATVTVRDCKACSRLDMEAPCVFCMVRWLLAPAQEKDGGAK